MSSPRQQIVTDEQVRQIMAMVLDMPQRVLDAQNLIEDAQFQVATFGDDVTLKEKLKEIEAEAYFEVKAEKGDDGKTAFTNEEQRQAQVMIRCNKDPEYIATLDRLTRALRVKAEMQMHLGKLVNQAKYATNLMYAYKSAAEVVAGLSVEDVDSTAWRKLTQIKTELNSIMEQLGGATNGK